MKVSNELSMVGLLFRNESPTGDIARAGTASRRAGVALALALAAAAASGGCVGNRALDAFCDDSSCAFSSDEWRRLQALTGLPAPSPDLSNAVDGNPDAIALGQAFFSDARFSGTATQVDALRRPASVARAPQGQPTGLACSSCHDLGRAGIDTTSVPGNVSAGAGWTDVNALGIFNSAYQRLFTWNGRADSLWSQAFSVAESPTTMNGDRLNTAWIIAQSYEPAYDLVFRRYGGALAIDGSVPQHGKPGAKAGCQPYDPTEPFGDAWDCLDPSVQDRLTRVLVNWAKAIAAYEARLVSRNAAFDVFMREGPQSSAISVAAKRGARLFVGKASCIDCHNTPLLSDGDFHNVGVPQVGPGVPTEADCPAGGVCDCAAGKNCLPWGALDGLAKLKASQTLRSSVFSDDQQDESRAADVARAADSSLEGAWRTPSLRNVGLTAPYMHDGAYASLAEVVAHYNRGGDPTAVGTRAVDIRPIGLTAGEQADLVAFLETLTESAGPVTGAGGATSGGGGGGPATTGGAGFGGGGAAGSAGAAGGSAGTGMMPACSGVPLPSPLITGGGFNLIGAPYAFSPPGLPAPSVSALPSPGGPLQALQVSASPGIATSAGNYFGFGFPFVSPPCVDARAFTGVQFTVSGDLGSCTLVFGVVPSEDNSAMYGPVGTCVASNCVPPTSKPIGIGTTVVHFVDLSGGTPLPTVDPAALNGVQWTLSAPTDPTATPCTANLTISDVSFVSDFGATGAGGIGGIGGIGGRSTGAAGTTGTTPPPAPCPLFFPVAGSGCMPEGLLCTYGDAPRAECRDRAICQGGRWTTAPSRCEPPVLSGCPPTPTPQTLVTCPPAQAGLLCLYPSDGYIECQCNSTASGDGTFNCVFPTVTPPPCPARLPNAGTVCTVAGPTCLYPCAASFYTEAVSTRCANGAWIWAERACGP